MSDDEISGEAAARASLPREGPELELALRDVAYRLTHDLHDTGEDIRDAVAFAPLWVVKALNDLVTRASSHPRKLALAVLLLAGGSAVILSRRLHRKSRAGRTD